MNLKTCEAGAVVGQDRSWRSKRIDFSRLPGKVLAYVIIVPLLLSLTGEPLCAHEIRPALLEINERQTGVFVLRQVEADEGLEGC